MIHRYECPHPQCPGAIPGDSSIPRLRQPVVWHADPEYGEPRCEACATPGVLEDDAPDTLAGLHASIPNRDVTVAVSDQFMRRLRAYCGRLSFDLIAAGMDPIHIEGEIEQTIVTLAERTLEFDEEDCGLIARDDGVIFPRLEATPDE